MPALGVVLALAGLGVAGCGGTAVKSTGDSTPAGQLSSSATPVSPRPSTPATSTTGAAPATGSATPAGLTGHLIAAAQVPAFGGVDGWTVQATGPAGPEPFGACQEYDFATIGATSALVRSYTAVDGPDATAAAERVVSFPDATNAARAAKVLESFRATCAKRLRGQLPHLAVSTARAVPVPSGTASSYTVSWSPADGSSAHHTEEIGTVVLGSTIAVITLESDTAPAGGGSDPMRHTLAAAAQLLG